MRKNRKQKRSWFGWLGNLLSSSEYAKYVFVVVDGLIILGLVLLVTSAIRPDKKLPDKSDPEIAQLTVTAPENEKDTESDEITNTDQSDLINSDAESEDPDKDEQSSDQEDLIDGPDIPENEENAPSENNSSEAPASDGASDTAAPETAPPETPPAEPETPATEPPAPEIPATEPPAPETPATEPPAPETAPPPVTQIPYVGNIHALSQDQINAIRANYDCNGRGYGGITYFQAAPSVQSQMDSMGINCRTLVPGGNTVALTFQEGWEPGYTGQLLDILAQKGVKGNFYITHEYAASRPDLVWRMINEGHTVGSHTYACPNTAIAYFNLEDIMNDAMQMQQYMLSTFGYDMHAYNYNSGAWSPGSAKMLSDMGYTVVLCSNSYSDYSAYDYIDPNVWLPQLKAGLIPGSIYAFHVTNPVTVQMIGPLIDYIRSMGYTFVLI